MEHRRYYYGLLWIIWTVIQFLFIVLLMCTINVHCIVKKAIPLTWIISCVLAREAYYRLRDIYISSICLIVVIGSLMLSEYGTNGLNQVVGVNLWWARGRSTFYTVTAAEDVSFTQHAHGMCFFNFYNNMKLFKHSKAHLQQQSCVISVFVAQVYSNNISIHVHWLMYPLLWAWKGPSVALAVLHNYSSYFPWLCGIPHRQSHVLSIICRSTCGLIFSNIVAKKVFFNTILI